MINLIDGDYRISVKRITAGQRGLYADTIDTYQVYFEWIPYDTRVQPKDKKFEPSHWNQDLVEKYLRAINNWNNDNKWPGPRLGYIKNLEPGLWEFSVIRDYTD